MNLDCLDFNIEYFVNRKSTNQWRIDEHLLTNHNLMFVYEGKCSYIVNNKEYVLIPGQAIYVPPGFTRKAFTYENQLMKCYAIDFNLIIGSGNISDEPLFFSPGMDNELLELFNLQNQNWILKDPSFKLKSRGLLILIIYRLLNFNRSCIENLSDYNRIFRAKKYIASNLSEQIQIKDITNILNINPIYFGHLFYKCEGITIKKYINKKRIQLACELLKQNNLLVKEISYQCGYNDIFYFSKIFKSIMGISPSRYLK